MCGLRFFSPCSQTLRRFPRAPRLAPSAEVAKLCMRYSYVVYPYKRPGSVRMSGDRQNYFKDCVAREGKVPEPASPKS